MPQGAFGFVVGQRPKRVREDGKNRLPVVQKLDCKFMRLGMRMPSHLLAYAFFKLELLKVKHQLNHFALRRKLYIKALQASFAELQRLTA